MGKGRFCREFAVKTNKIMDLNTVKTVVVKIGTSTLTYENGKMNLRRIDKLCRTLCDLQNGGRRIVLVTSGAIGVGMGKLGLPERPDDTAKKQALAAIGQCELMFAYDKILRRVPPECCAGLAYSGCHLAAHQLPQRGKTRSASCSI